MADLQNLQMHMRGKAVLVNGTLYAIGQKDGIARKVKPKDAKKLLLSKNWCVAKSKPEVEPEVEPEETEKTD